MCVLCRPLYFFESLIFSGTRDNIIFVPKTLFDTIFYSKYEKASFFKTEKLGHSHSYQKVFFPQAPTFFLRGRPIFGSIFQLIVREKITI